MGILTWFFAANYGAKAHTLALQECLMRMGIDVEVIDYIPPEAKNINLKINIVHPVKKNLDSLFYGSLRCLKFNRFNRNYHFSRKVSSAQEIDSLGYDFIILGSDEVFNVVHPVFNPIYYGVGINKTRCISYAPSMGQMPTNYQLPSAIIKAVNKLNYISVRDSHSAKVLSQYTNKDVYIVCDPTFFLNFNRYYKRVKEKRYVLVYSFDDLKDYADKILEYAHSKNMSVITVGRKSTWVDHSYITADEELWLGAFANASLVVTDSFHGTVFSIKNHVDYVVVNRADKTNKITGLHSYLGIEREFYDGKITVNEYLDRNALNYESIEKKVDLCIEESMRFLRGTLC